ncbi:MAG: hypothetical protein R3F13_20865 [Prosthecobacter sp.]
MKTLFYILSAILLISCSKSEPQSGGATAKDTYPLDVCVVSGEKLGSMGEPHVITHEGVEVRFCCDHCVPKFNADPATYIAKIKEAAAK